MNPIERTFIRDVPITRIGLGTAPLGGLFSEVTDDAAEQTVTAAYDAGIRFFDTAPLYGYGTAERRLGAVLAPRPRGSFSVASKVGRLIRDVDATDTRFEIDTTQLSDGEPIYKSIGAALPVFDFSYDGALKSVEETLARTHLDRLDIVHVHDPDDHLDQATDGALRALFELRESGVIGAVGVGIDNVEPAMRFIRDTDIDCLLIAGRWSLLDRSAGAELLPEAERRGIAIIAAGVFNSGILADPGVNRTFDYRRASDTMIHRALRMQSLCEARQVSLAAAALQFPLRHRAVRAVVIGARTPGEVRSNIRAAGASIPEELWGHLDLIAAGGDDDARDVAANEKEEQC